MGERYVPRGRLLADGQAGATADDAAHAVAADHQVFAIPLQGDGAGLGPAEGAGGGVIAGRIPEKTLIVQVLLLHGSSSF